MTIRAARGGRRRTLAGFAGTAVPRTSAEGTRLYGLTLMLVMLVFFLLMYWGSTPGLLTKAFENQAAIATAEEQPVDPALRAELLKERFGGAPIEQDRDPFAQSAAWRNLIASVATKPPVDGEPAPPAFDPVRAHADPEALRGQRVLLRGAVPLAAGVEEKKLDTAVGDVTSVWRTFVTDFEGKNPAFVDLIRKPEGVTSRHAVTIDAVFYRLVGYETGGDRKAEVPWLVAREATIDRDADGADFLESPAYAKALQRAMDHVPSDVAEPAVPFDREKALRDPDSVRGVKVLVKGLVAGERGLFPVKLDQPVFSLTDVYRGVITSHQGDTLGDEAVIVDFVERPPSQLAGRDVIEAECRLHRLVSYELRPDFAESEKSRRLVHGGGEESTDGRGEAVPRRRLVPWLVARTFRVVPEERRQPLGVSNTTALIFGGILLLLTIYGIVRVFVAHRAKPPVRAFPREALPKPSPAAPPDPGGSSPPESKP